MMTKQLFTTQENHCSLKISKPELKEKVGYSMSRWEVCELVGNYLLYELLKLYEKKDIGLCRDNSIQAIFRQNELKITIQCNLKIVDYLDVTFNLRYSSYHPFNK